MNRIETPIPSELSPFDFTRSWYIIYINGSVFHQMGHLSVVIPPDIADEDGSEASAPEGGSVELHCSAAGVPEPTISWKRTGGRNIVFRDENGKEEKGSSLHIH